MLMLQSDKGFYGSELPGVHIIMNSVSFKDVWE